MATQQLNYGYQSPGLGLPAPTPSVYDSMSTWGAPNYSFNGMGNRGGLGVNPNTPAPGFQLPQTGSGFGGGSTLYGPGQVGGSGAAPASDWSWLGTRDQQGVAGLALGGAQALGGLYLGMQQYNVAKDTLAANKAQFERQFQANKTMTNASLEDRQRARVAANAGAYQSVGDYMNQNGVK